jgi:hypothetical protein
MQPILHAKIAIRLPDVQGRGGKGRNSFVAARAVALGERRPQGLGRDVGEISAGVDPTPRDHAQIMMEFGPTSARRVLLGESLGCSGVA